MSGVRKGRIRGAKSCASIYRKSGGLEGFLVQQKTKRQRNEAVKENRQIRFETDVEKQIANVSINDSNIQNCNKMLQKKFKQKNTEALWARIKEVGVSAQGEDDKIM
ncbi:hypothetical protein SLA2020_034910 [Shorea laevis]